MSLHPRVEALVAAHQMANAVMRELPLYNPALVIEAHGFAPLAGGMLLGVLITPWFMNLVALPEVVEPLDPARYGSARAFALPAGERVFRYAGDAAQGAFWAASLHSPMAVFRSQPQARAEARLRLAEALTPPSAEADHVACPSRRAFFGGKLAARGEG
ncbi:MAG: [NiFe]-hydrogenase assembly chaperone HybE [Burkholderiaceae bacterium]|nr:[NiFe]-hydrogenase assembly chaperone HybE [Burkholderiaceae bacterium]